MAFGDERTIPSAAVLLVERDELTAGDTSEAPRMGEQHQREQAGDLTVIREQRAQDPRQPDCLGREVGADGVVAGAGEIALVEHQVDDCQHTPQPFGQVFALGDAVRDVGGLDLGLGTGDALGHCRLRHEERACDLVDREAAEQAQRESHAGLGCEGRVAAREHQPEAVVLDRPGRLVRCVVGDHQGSLVLRVAQRFASDPVDGAVARRGRQPPARVGWDAVDRPSLDGGEEGLARRVLGDVEITEATGERSHHAAVLLAVDTVDRRACVGSWTHTGENGRTSTLPPQAFDASAASLRAASMSGTSTIQKPPRNSLVSAYGPSETITSLPVPSTVVAVSMRSSPPPKTQIPSSMIRLLNASVASYMGWACSGG